MDIRPKTAAPFDLAVLEDVRRNHRLKANTLKNVLLDPEYAEPMPSEVSIQLTYKCNLRCTHCFQWNDRGFFRDYSMEKQRTELDISIVEQVLEATQERQSALFLWGGEPLMHSQFSAIADLVSKYQRIVHLCTNGLLLKRHSDSLLKISPDLNLLISLDGLPEQHEALRGPRTFQRTTENIEHMLMLRDRGEFKGEIWINCMVSAETVDSMYEIAEWAEGIGVDSLYFGFPWYISPDVASSMDELYARCFEWLNPLPDITKPTWHSYTYQLPPDQIPTLRKSLGKLASRRWNMRVRYTPQLEDDEIEDFILGTSRPAQRKSRCLAVSNRMEVHADGTVTSCKFFPEFAVGNLYQESVSEIWQGERFRGIRSTLAETGLMPVCSKCVLLYLNGV